jgi:porphobilinogen synthase
MNLINRPRRLRNGALLRSMVRETRISADTLIYPMFVQDGENIREEIPSMPGQYRWSLDRVDELLQQVTDSGVKSVLLFGIPAEKDEIGSSAWQPDGIVQRAVHHIKAAYPQLYVITDVCMCEYTSHGHCGILCGHDVDNDKTLEVLAKTALSHVQAGADMVAPSDMMDGRVARIRQVLDENGYVNTPIMSIPSSMPRHSMARSGMRQVLRRRSAIGKAIRWIPTMHGRRCWRQNWTCRRVQIF